MTYRGRIRALLALVIIFIMVSGINRINSNNFSVVQDSFESIYKDRVVVNDYIFRLGLFIENRRSVLNGDNNSFRYMDYADDSVDFLLEQYAVTKFTEKEAVYFDLLKDDIQIFRSLESALLNNENEDEKAKLISEVNNRGEKILGNLTVLSQIQVSESKLLFENSNDRIYTSYLNAQLELVFLIVICVILITLLVVNPFYHSLKSRLSDLN